MKVVVAGAGIGGLATAIALRMAGCDVRVYERRREPEEGGGALLIWPNGAAALRALGLWDEVIAAAPRVERVDFVTAAGVTSAVWPVDTRRGERVQIVLRAALLRGLRTRVPDGVVEYCAAVDGFADERGHVEVLLAGGRRERTDALIGCDGVHSRVQAQLFGQPKEPRLRQLVWFAIVPFSDHGRVPFGIAQASTGDGRRFCIARLDAENVYFYATATERNRPGAEGTRGVAEVFRGWHPLVQDVIAASAGVLVGPITPPDRQPLRRWTRGRVTLLGDAAHACLPDLGQGAGQALESAVALGAASGPDVESWLCRYEARRRDASTKAIRTSRFLASWSMSENVNVKPFRDFLAPHVLPLIGFPIISRIARQGFR